LTQKDYDSLSEKLIGLASSIENAKRPEYTNNSVDVLRNFKQCGVEAGVSAEQAWIVYAKKHWDAIRTNMMNPNQNLSEPIEGRFADLINYLKLGYALYIERQNAALEGKQNAA
jgi:hypothetical protein